MIVKELGCAGHYILSHRCRFRRHTQIGDKYRVSTVGELETDGKTENVGIDRLYETMVFETTPAEPEESNGCGCREVVNWIGIETVSYNSPGAANKGHDDIVTLYATYAERGQE